jgi:alginate O-acetyltransferase complex protein AlgI
MSALVMETHGVEGKQSRQWLGAAAFLVPMLVLPLQDQLPAWAFMWLLSFTIFGACKWLTWWEATKRVSSHRSIPYLLLWPGMNADEFLDSNARVERPHLDDWLKGIARTAFGAALLWLVARHAPGPLTAGWIGMFGLITFLHFGTFLLLALAWQSVGVNARPLMQDPARATSLTEFWSTRWNVAFNVLAKRWIFRPAARRFGPAGATLAVFLASGLVHDFVISLPARSGFGLPTAFFLLQGFGVLLERSSLGKRLGLQQPARGRLLVAFFTIGPAFWLFHPPFVERVILPFLKIIGAL